MILWTNLHGGFLAGIGLLGIYSLCEFVSRFKAFQRFAQSPIDNRQFKRLLLVFILSIAATLINPYHVKLWTFLGQTLTKSRPFIDEWLPVTAKFLSVDNSMHYIMLLVISLVILLAARPKLYLAQACLFFVAMVLSLRHTRHVPFFTIAAMFIVPLWLEQFILSKRRQLIPLLRGVSIVLLCIINIVLLYDEIGRRGKDFFQIRLERYYYPVREVEFLKNNNFQGNVLAEFDWAEYCIWKLYPQCKIAVDGRYMTVYPPRAINSFFNFLNAKEGWQEFFNAYSHQWILIGKFRPVLRLVMDSGQWSVVCNSPYSLAVLLVRKDSAAYSQFIKKLNAGQLIYPAARSDYFFP